VAFEQYVHTALFVPSGINSASLAATDLANANCNPDLSKSNMQPLYYQSGAIKTNDTGIPETNDRPRGLKVCGAGAMQAAVWQLDLFARALMTGIQGGSPFLTTDDPDDRDTMLRAGMFGGPSAYPGLGQVFAKNGGWPMCSEEPNPAGAQNGIVSGIVMARDINTQLAAIVNTQGTDPSTNLEPNPNAALINGLVRMHSTPLGVFSVRSRNNTNFGDMCLNVSRAALADFNPDGSLVNIIQWPCGSPVANNMLFVQLDTGAATSCSSRSTAAIASMFPARPLPTMPTSFSGSATGRPMSCSVFRPLAADTGTLSARTLEMHRRERREHLQWREHHPEYVLL
jgi:hypothetical protein